MTDSSTQERALLCSRCKDFDVLVILKPEDHPEFYEKSDTLTLISQCFELGTFKSVVEGAATCSLCNCARERVEEEIGIAKILKKQRNGDQLYCNLRWKPHGWHLHDHDNRERRPPMHRLKIGMGIVHGGTAGKSIWWQSQNSMQPADWPIP